MNVQELYEKGFELRCNGNYGEAKSMLQQVLSEQDDHADANWQLGLIAGFEGDFNGSIALLKAVVRTDANHIGARYDLAMTYMMLGMESEACEEFREVLKQNPDHEKAKQQIIYCP